MQRQRESSSPWPRDCFRRQAAGRRRPSALEAALFGTAQPEPVPRRTVELRHRAEEERDLELKRCEGFVVDSPLGEVGVVEGVLFLSSTDRPDELEIRVGRLHTEVIVVPVEEVEHVSLEDESVRLRRDPRRRHHLALRALVAHFLRTGAIP